MAFNSLNYSLFLIIILMITWGLARHRLLRLGVLLAASWFFYMSSPGPSLWIVSMSFADSQLELTGVFRFNLYVFLIVGSTVVDYFCGLGIHSAKSVARKKLLLTVSLCSNLGLLGTFKYYDFFVSSAQDLLNHLGWLDPGQTLPLLQVMLPVGISFYTFQTMAYSIDVYRGRQEPIRNFIKFATFVSYFPQLVAGPIVHARELVPQLEKPPQVTVQQIHDGLFRLMKGLVKKVAIADWLALNLVDRVYDQPELFTSAEVLVALYAYSMQIYCDFSGYTDMAIGSAKLFGYELPENFDRPYAAPSVAKFWRRWHMTLSRWVREYIYFPMGGTKRGESRAYFNIVAALVIMGLWHGANWTFFWYGLIHGFVVCINRWSNQQRIKKGIDYDPRGWALIWRAFLALLFVTLARILFRAQDMTQAHAVTEQLMGSDWTVGHIGMPIWVVLIGSYAIHFTPVRWMEKCRDLFAMTPLVLQGAILAIVCMWMVYLSHVQPVPFIYFQF